MIAFSNRLSDFVNYEVGGVPRSYKDMLTEELISFHPNGRELDSILRKRAENMVIKEDDIV